MKPTLIRVLALLAATTLLLLHDPAYALLAPRLGLGAATILLRGVELLLLGVGLWALQPVVAAALRSAVSAWDKLIERALRGLPPWQVRLAGPLILTLGTGALMATLSERANVFGPVESRILDGWFRLMFPALDQAERAIQAPAEAKRVRDDVVVVTIDNETVKRLGWPMPRKYYAQFIDAMTDAGASSVVFDVILVDENADHPDWDVQVGEAARRNGHVILGYPIVPRSGEIAAAEQAELTSLVRNHTAPATQVEGALTDFSIVLGSDVRPDPVIAAIASGARGLASTNVVLDSGDEVLRHSVLVFRVGDRLYPSLMGRTALEALGVPLDALKVVPGSHIDFGGKARMPIDDAGKSLVRYQGRYDEAATDTFPHVPLFHVLRRDVSFALPGNPLGEELRFELRPTSRITVNGKVLPLDEVDLALLKDGAHVRGRAMYSTDPARILELEVLTGALAEPAYEMEDETHLTFDDAIKGLKVARADARQFKGKHVLFGSTATAAADIIHTPLGAMPGIEHHATVLNNILNQDVMVHSPAWVNLLLALLMALLVGVAAGRLNPSAGAAAVAVLLLLLVAGIYTAFTRGMYVPIVALAGTVVLGYMLAVIHGFRREQKEKATAEEGREFIRRTFGRYLTEQVVDTLLSSPKGLQLGGERRNVTIVMTDLRGFTAMSAAMEPESVVSILNNYLAIMTDIVVKYEGTIDEFIGDAILVVFGAPVQKPDDAVRAVACSLEMLMAMDRVNAWNVEHGLPPVSMGIGVNTGEVVVGNIGSEKRAKYGIVGTPINMCARVESYTVGGQLLIAESTRNDCGDALVIRDSMTVQAKGLAKPLTLFDVVSVTGRYPVSLPYTPEELRPVAEPVRMKFVILAGKHAGTDQFEADVVRLSDQGMEARLGQELESLSNLKLAVLNKDGSAIAGDLYGKVTKPKVSDGVSYVRFTAIPPDVEAFLKRARDAARSDDKADVTTPLGSSVS